MQKTSTSQTGQEASTTNPVMKIAALMTALCTAPTTERSRHDEELSTRKQLVKLSTSKQLLKLSTRKLLEEAVRMEAVKKESQA
jgi:hypothetical protein